MDCKMSDCPKSDEVVRYRELETMLDPIIKGQDRIEKKVDSLIDHKDNAATRLTKLEVRVALIWAVIATVGVSLVAWVASHMKWG
jgi:hypothetical protein